MGRLSSAVAPAGMGMVKVNRSFPAEPVRVIFTVTVFSVVVRRAAELEPWKPEP